MPNYGERLAYWYLRLQGFCSVENFVQHRGSELDHTSDADLLAVRLRDSCEEIDGEVLAPDERLAVPLRFSERHVALIVQVKTGRSGGAGRAFEPDRLRYALRFLGVPGAPGGTDAIAMSLANQPTALAGRFWMVGKLLVSETHSSGDALSVTMDQVLGFVVARLTKYSNVKDRDRTYFPDELLQYLAWRTRGGAGGALDL